MKLNILCFDPLSILSMGNEVKKNMGVNVNINKNTRWETIGTGIEMRKEMMMTGDGWMHDCGSES